MSFYALFALESEPFARQEIDDALGNR